MSDSPWEKAPIDPRGGGGKVVKVVGGFKSFADRLDREREDRLALRGKMLSFGVRFLNNALGGIFPHDLVLLGAASGIGKTDLASNIALANARKGVRVHYFALEAEEREIERRLKFKLVSEMVRKLDGAQAARRLNFLDWYMGEIDDLTGRHETNADAALRDAMKTLKTFYRVGDFYAEHFEALVREAAPDTDLIVLDHLHYIDSEEPNENRGFRLIVKRIRDVALDVGKPVVAVAHIRKAERRGGRIFPTLEDFHGTSDVPKIATKAIMLAPAGEIEGEEPPPPWMWPTYVGAVKCRFDSTRTRFVGRLSYDARAGGYLDEYDIGRLSPSGDKWERLMTKDPKFPDWARAR